MAPCTGRRALRSARRNFKIACYTAEQIERAYNLGPLYAQGTTGKGETIVIVDSYGSPTVAHDLAVFDKGGAPARAAVADHHPARGQGRAVPAERQPRGLGRRDRTRRRVRARDRARREDPAGRDADLGERGQHRLPAIVKAEKYVISHHLGGVISQSFSATEQSFANAGAAAAPARRLHRRGQEGRHGAHRLRRQRRGGRRVQRGLPISCTRSRPGRTATRSSPGSAARSSTSTRPAATSRPPTVWNDTYNVPTLEYISGEQRGRTPLAGGGGKSVIFGRPAYQNGVASVVGAAAACRTSR